jgi:hypothetical protein
LRNPWGRHVQFIVNRAEGVSRRVLCQGVPAHILTTPRVLPSPGALFWTEEMNTVSEAMSSRRRGCLVSESDELILEQMRQGDEVAFEQLFRVITGRSPTCCSASWLAARRPRIWPRKRSWRSTTSAVASVGRHADGLALRGPAGACARNSRRSMRQSKCLDQPLWALAVVPAAADEWRARASSGVAPASGKAASSRST